MRKSRYSDSQILAILKQNENGVSVPELCREHGMSTAMFYKWRSKFGGMDASMMKRLKELEDENKRLKKMYAEERLKAEIRQEALEGIPIKRGRPSCNAISASGDGDGNQRAIRRECSVCVPLLGYQRGNVLLQAQVVP